MKWKYRGIARNFARSYSSSLHDQAALEEIGRLRDSLVYADSTTYGLLLRHCCKTRALEQGKLIHSHILKRGYGQDTFLGNLLVKMYSSCGCIEEAQAVFLSIRHKNVFSWNIMTSAFAHSGNIKKARDSFDRTPRKDTVSWTTMITTYAQSGSHAEALQLFKLMDQSGAQPDRAAFVSVLNACSSKGSLSETKTILELIDGGAVDPDVVLGTCMVSIYGKSGQFDKATAVFTGMSEKNVISWTVMIEANVEKGDVSRARDIFEKMPEWTTAPWVVMIRTYCKLGELMVAEILLDRMVHRNVAAWTVVVSANAHAGHLQNAAVLLQRMDQEGVPPDKITLISILDGCAKYGALEVGAIIEAGITGTEFMTDDTIVTNLINVHGKCGSLEHALELFDHASLLESVILWSAMMAALAQNDRGDEAIELFKYLLLYGLEPTRVTFNIVLFVCSHGGLLKKGWEYFLTMQDDHFLTPDADHYVSMIDLLGRSSQLGLAFELIKTMPFVPDDVAWTILLNASKVYGESKRGSEAARYLMNLRHDDSAPYVLLASACRSSSRQPQQELPCQQLSNLVAAV